MIQYSIKIFILLVTAAQFSSCGLLKKTAVPFNPTTTHKTFPKPVGYVNDFENILSKREEKELGVIIKAHERQTTNQIAIITIQDYQPYSSLMEYAIDLANYWGVGHKNKNNGVVMVFGKNIREIWISNGSGIETKLSDFDTKKIIDEIIIPQFKKGDYFLGTKNGLLAIIEKLNMQ